jgi:hypothetical protein
MYILGSTHPTIPLSIYCTETHIVTLMYKTTALLSKMYELLHLQAHELLADAKEMYKF